MSPNRNSDVGLLETEPEQKIKRKSSLFWQGKGYTKDRPPQKIWIGWQKCGLQGRSEKETKWELSEIRFQLTRILERKKKFRLKFFKVTRKRGSYHDVRGSKKLFPCQDFCLSHYCSLTALTEELREKGMELKNEIPLGSVTSIFYFVQIPWLLNMILEIIQVHFNKCWHKCLQSAIPCVRPNISPPNRRKSKQNFNTKLKWSDSCPNSVLQKHKGGALDLKTQFHRTWNLDRNREHAVQFHLCVDWKNEVQNTEETCPRLQNQPMAELDFLV